MASIVEKINRIESEVKKEFVELLEKASQRYSGELLKKHIDIINRTYVDRFILGDGYILKSYESTYGDAHSERKLTYEQFSNMLILEEVRSVAERLNIVLGF